MKVPYVDFGPTTKFSRVELTKAFDRVLDSGKFVLGPEVKNFELEFAKYCGTEYAAGLANGTCSLHIVFRALGIQEGDEVITAPNSFIATAAAIFAYLARRKRRSKFEEVDLYLLEKLRQQNVMSGNKPKNRDTKY